MLTIYTPLLGKKLLVFGGSSGIGFGVAELGLKEGMKVFIGSSSNAKVDAAVAELKKSFPKGEVTGKAVDLTSDEDVKSYVEWAAGSGKSGIDHIVSTAGDAAALAAGTLQETEVSEYNKHLQVRYWGILRIVKAAQPFWNKSASLTVTSGTVSITPPKGWMVAAGMGAGITGLARGLAEDLAPLRVNCVVPGAIETPLWDNIGSEEMKRQVLQTSASKTLTGTVGSALDCAFAYIYLMSSSFATGSSIVIDGGLTINRA